MRIGLVGKPNVGKSTSFSALTETPVEIANYPFTTIDPNVGVAWLPLREPCACSDLRERREAEGRLEKTSIEDTRNGSICSPNSGTCRGHTRLVPVTMIDVAGLVPGAHKGRGRGNQFLSDLARCDALIQVVDASGSTDIEGNPVGSGGPNPLEEYQFLIAELDAWIGGILSNGWERGARRVQAEGERGLTDFILGRLTGIGATERHVSVGITAVNTDNPDAGMPWTWNEKEIISLASAIRTQLFPIFIAANKADKSHPDSWKDLSQVISSSGGVVVPTSAEAELALRRASSAGLIENTPGDFEFEITEMGEKNMSEKQKIALESISSSLGEWEGGGLLGLLGEVVFGVLGMRVAYPVQDETHWADGDGKTLPDAILVPSGTTAKGLAYYVHSDLGDGFIRAVDGRTGRAIGAEYEIIDRDVIRIHSKN